MFGNVRRLVLNPKVTMCVDWDYRTTAILPAPCYASVVRVYLSVCLSQAGIASKRLNGWDSFGVQVLTLCRKGRGIWVSSEISVLPPPWNFVANAGLGKLPIRDGIVCEF